MRLVNVLLYVIKKNLHINYTIGIRSVTSIDGMTSDWASIPWEVLSTRIVQ